MRSNVDSGTGLDTRIVHSGVRPGPDGEVVPPLHFSTTFARTEQYELPGDFVYGRYGSPTLNLAEEALSALDGGAEALLFGAGLGATFSVLETLKEGARLVAPTIMYHGAHDWMRRLMHERRIDVSLFDAAEPGSLESVLADGDTDMVWIESPVNPTWDVIDIAEAAKAAHAVGATLVVDSTVAPPVTTRPLELGADIVLHSATKYLNGHSDVLGGLLVTRNVDDRWEEIRTIRKLTGGSMAPMSAWLLLRGLRTLHIRYQRSSETALLIAQRFESHPAVEAVLYPGLATHRGHAVARRQMTGGFGGMLSLLVRGSEAETKDVAKALRVFYRATSLGGVESLAEHRASVEGPHSVVPKNLIRLSVGLEDPTDLVSDLEQAFESAGLG